MKLADFVVLLMVLTFLPFNEGIIAKSPRWKKLADLIEFGAIKAVSWRANANVTAELEVLERYFRKAAYVIIALFLIALFIKSQPLILWASSVGCFCLFSSFSFRWTFRHAETLKTFKLKIGFALASPWLLLAMDYLAPEAGLMKSFSNALAFLPFKPTKPVDIAANLFGLISAFFGFYYLFFWLLLSPFAYAVLAGLKLSSAVSTMFISKFNRNFLNDFSIFVQFFGLVYLYWIGRPSS
jgi:hypothetical protein